MAAQPAVDPGQGEAGGDFGQQGGGAHDFAQVGQSGEVAHDQAQHHLLAQSAQGFLQGGFIVDRAAVEDGLHRCRIPGDEQGCAQLVESSGSLSVRRRA